MITETIRKALLTAAIAFTLSGAALSHEATKGANGGVLIDVDGHHIEFVPSPNELTFYLTDDKDAPLSAAGAKMKAIVQDGGKTIQVDLSAVEPNKLTAPIAIALSSGAKVVVTGTLSDGHSLQGRFQIP
jgi:hypothetical protein